MYVRGDLSIAGAPADAPGLNTRAALCRCGQSNNKPFCDNSHEGAVFRDRGAVGEQGEPLASPSGTLSVRPLPDGPLLVNGPLTILSSSGRPAWTGEKTALCRCGESSKKPFCDGTHVVTGFTAEGAE
jgi:CDGSH-type Zn-finger protein